MSENALILRKEELKNNPSARVAVCLVLDTSGSMDGEPIRNLNEGVRNFIEAVKSDPVAKYSAEIAIVTFGGDIEVYADFGSVERFHFQDLHADGSTPMEEAVLTAIDLLNTRKKEYVDSGIDYYQPWMIIMSDGQPDSKPVKSSKITYDLASNKKLSCFQIAVCEEADMSALAMFSPRPVQLLKNLNFQGFFEWLSKSIQVVSQSTPGDNISLPNDNLNDFLHLDL